MTVHQAELIASWDEGRLMRGLRLSSVPAYRAGQAIKVLHQGESAYFALATADGNGRAPELLLRRGGVVADALITEIEVGAVVQFEGPLGPGFPLENARGRDVLLVAVGAGISAIRAVLETLLDERSAYGRIALFYGQEHAPDFAYAAARGAWSRAGVDITLCLHGEDPNGGVRGFVQDAIAKYGPGVDSGSAVAYLCGMPQMVASVREVLAEQGLDSARTYLNL